MSDHRLVLPVPAVDFEAPTALLQGSLVALERGSAIELMLDEIGVVRGVAKIVVDGERFVMVDHALFGVEDTVDLAENPGAKVLEGNCMRQFAL